MQENNFEKGVQQKLDGLHLTPSEPVWQKIEAAIKKKRERRLVFWILPLLLVTGGSGVWWLTTLQPEKAGRQQATEQIDEKQTFSKPHAGETPKEPELNPTPPQPTRLHRIRTSAVSKAENKNPAVERSAGQKHPDVENKVASSRTQNTHLNPLRTTTNAAVFEASMNHSHAIVEKVTGVNIPRASVLTGKKPVTPDAKSKIVIEEKDRFKISKPSVQATVKATWRWHITGRAGASDIRGKLFSLSALQPGRIANFFESTSSSDNFSLSGAAGRQSSWSTRGLQFSIGAGLKKVLRRNSTLVTGLQYSFYRNHVTTEPYLPADRAALLLYNINVARSAYSNTRIASRFTNAFHFIELPVGFEHRLLKRLPLHVQYGVAITQLVSGKGVRYNSNTNLYSQDAAALRKTGAALYTALDYTVWKGSGFSLQAGPHVQYGLRTLFKNTPANNHLVSAGAAVTMAF